MSTPELLLQALRTEMRRAGLTYRELAGRVGMSESSIKRVFSQGDMSLSRLAQFCQAAGVSMHSTPSGASPQGPFDIKAASTAGGGNFCLCPVPSNRSSTSRLRRAARAPFLRSSTDRTGHSVGA